MAQLPSQSLKPRTNQPWYFLFPSPTSSVPASPNSMCQSDTSHLLSQPSCSLACKAVRASFLLLLLLPIIYFHVVAKAFFFWNTVNHIISLLKILSGFPIALKTKPILLSTACNSLCAMTPG